MDQDEKHGHDDGGVGELLEVHQLKRIADATEANNTELKRLAAATEAIDRDLHLITSALGELKEITKELQCICKALQPPPKPVAKSATLTISRLI